MKYKTKQRAQHQKNRNDRGDLILPHYYLYINHLICSMRIVLRETVCVVWRLFLSHEGALVTQINVLHFLKQRKFTKIFNAGHMCVLIVRVQNCECEWTIIVLLQNHEPLGTRRNKNGKRFHHCSSASLLPKISFSRQYYSSRPNSMATEASAAFAGDAPSPAQCRGRTNGNRNAACLRAHFLKSPTPFDTPCVKLGSNKSGRQSITPRTGCPTGGWPPPRRPGGANVSKKRRRQYPAEAREKWRSSQTTTMGNLCP